MGTSMRYGRCITSSKQKVENRIFTLIFQRIKMWFSSSHTIIPHKLVSGSFDEKSSNQLKINTIFESKNPLRVLNGEIRWLWNYFIILHESSVLLTKFRSKKLNKIKIVLSALSISFCGILSFVNFNFSGRNSASGTDGRGSLPRILFAKAAGFALKDV